MHRKLLSLSLILILLLSLCSPAQALSSSDFYPVATDFGEEGCGGIPGTPEIWVVDCEEYARLWRSDYSIVYWCTLYPGDEVQVLDWSGKYAHVRFESYVGYVYSPCLRPAESPDLAKWLSIVEPVECYTHEAMVSDLQTLTQLTSWLPVTLSSIGTSEEGRDIPVLRIGREDAQHHVLLHGSIHGREHATTWLLMALAEFWIQRGMAGMENICLHIIPMVNPDGVHIAQTGQLSEEQQAICDKDYARYADQGSFERYVSRWKANADGIDLNKNFPTGWHAFYSREDPSSEKYKGRIPFNAAESVALRDYTLAWSFDATVSYHASGSVIYYEYGGYTETNNASKALARQVEAVTGYHLDSSGDASGAGYKDWAIGELGIPSLTVEIGARLAPLSEDELYSIFFRNLSVLPVIADWLE